MTPEHVPSATIGRLPIYLRCLLQAQAMRMPVINSVGIADMAGGNAAQVRKDLSYLGELGTRGLGYDVEGLINHISKVLGIHECRRVAIVGFGRLGSALQSYPGFEERGFTIAAVYDADPEKIGTSADKLQVRSIDELDRCVEELGVEIAMLAVPAEKAQAVLDRVVAAGVRAILNFAPVRLAAPPGVEIRQVDLAVELQILSFHLNRMEGRG